MRLVVLVFLSAVYSVPAVKAAALPRCSGIENEPYMELVGNAVDDVEGSRNYKLVSRENDCVYETMSWSRTNDCMQDRWLMLMGSSNAAVQMFLMMQLLLGTSRLDDYFGPGSRRSYSEWRKFYYESENRISLAMDFSSNARPLECWGGPFQPNCLPMQHVPGVGYMTGTHIWLIQDLIPSFEEFKFDKALQLPSPNVLIAVDQWLQECVVSMTNRNHWAYNTCKKVFDTMEDVSESAWLELNVKKYDEFLSYLRDEWPDVKEIYQETKAYMYKLVERFPETLLEQNGYPKVIWFRNRVNYDRVSERMIQGYHRHGPLAFASNEWWLDDVCRENRGKFEQFVTPYRNYSPTCAARNDYDFFYVPSCHSQESGDISTVSAVEDTTLAALNLTTDLLSINETTTETRTEFENALTPFHGILVFGSVLVLLRGAFVFYEGSLGCIQKKGFANLKVPSRSRRNASTCSSSTAEFSTNELQPDHDSEAWSTTSSSSSSNDGESPNFNRHEGKRANGTSDPPSKRQDFELELELELGTESEISNAEPTSTTSQKFYADVDAEKNSGYSMHQFIASGNQNRGFAPLKGDSVTTKPPTRAPKLLALGMARYIASVHIVIGHMMQGFSRPGDARAFPIGTFPTNGWGFSWVPFFMMLSGFVLTYARLFSSQPDKYMPWTTFTVQRIRGIYPLFLAGLFARAGQLAVLNETSFSLGSPFETISLLLLLQSWFPAVVVQGLQAHCWFLSCIVPYWALHQAMYRKIKEWTTRSLWAFVVGVTVVPFALLMLIPPALGVSVTWYSSWDGYTMNTNLHYAVAILKFHPVCYLHIYVFGMVTAVLVHRTEEHHRVIQSAFRQGGLIGFVALYAIFGISHYAVPPAYKLTCRLGLLAPIQGLYLIGLAKQEDPLSRFFSLGVFAPLENLSFPQYVFQFIAFFGWQSWMSIGFWLWLSALSLLGYYFVQSPLRSKSKPVKVQAWGVANIFVLAGFVTLLAFLFRYEILEQSFPKGMLPAVVEFPDGSVDVRIESSRALGLTINPSLLWLPEQDKMILAVRSHKYVRVVEGGYEDQIWYSDLYVDEVDTLTLQPMGRLENIMSSNAAWVSCPDLPYTYVPVNRTYTRTRVTGPEDPRLMLSKDGKVILTANLKDPAAAADGASAECSLNRRMLAGELDIDAMELAAQMSLMNSIEPSADTEEKNWLLFEHDGALKFVQSISPFTVVRVDKPLSGEASDVNVVVESSVFHSAISDLFALGLSVHGGANPILVSGNETNLRYVTTQGGESADTFLGIFHTKSVDGEYINFFFQFKLMEDTQDWRIVRVSKRIRVLESNFSVDSGVTAPMTFVSGLTGNEEHVFVSYGSSNAEARVIKMSWGVLNAYFA